MWAVLKHIRGGDNICSEKIHSKFSLKMRLFRSLSYYRLYNCFAMTFFWPKNWIFLIMSPIKTASRQNPDCVIAQNRDHISCWGIDTKTTNDEYIDTIQYIHTCIQTLNLNQNRPQFPIFLLTSRVLTCTELKGHSFVLVSGYVCQIKLYTQLLSPR